MIALLYFLFFVVYLLVSLWVIRIAYWFTKKRYQRGWVGGWLVAFVMYNLVFWDWTPVLVMHKYYCNTQAGFWVYKTPEQWVKEHPEVIGQDWSDSSKWKHESLNRNYEPDKSYYHEINRYWIDSLIYVETFHVRKNTFDISQTEKKIVDAKSGQILARSMNFQRGGSFYGGNYKFWLNVGDTSCSEAAYSGIDKIPEKFVKLVKGDKK